MFWSKRFIVPQMPFAMPGGPPGGMPVAGNPLADLQIPGAEDLDPMRLMAFMGRVMSEMSAAITGLLCAVGERRGLFAAMAHGGPGTAAEIAHRTGTHIAYAREWLKAMTCAGYIEYDPDEQTFSLPMEHAIILAFDRAPMFMGGGFEQLSAFAAALNPLLEDLGKGAGVSQAVFGERLLSGMERMSATWFDHFLVQQWLPQVREVRDLLERGGKVADVGCGSGRAVVRMAEAFPASKFVGFDLFDQALERARRAAKESSVADRATFQELDAAAGLPARAFDLVTLFDSLHDFVAPDVALAAVRKALRPGGVCLILEMNCSDDFEDDIGPVGTILYGTSFFYNTPASLANGGRGDGTMSMPASRIAALCKGAGFSEVTPVPIFNPFNKLYLARS